jgi:peptidoglycan/LPS O-acetylase OafA/YrhL
MVSHLALTGRLPWLPVTLVAFVGQRGGWGVTVFFVISGFLITFLLLLEERRTGRISLSRFYARRALRILPPAFAYLAILALLAAAGWVSVTRRDLLSAALIVRNLTGSPDVYTAHFWSLSIEEQFYLVWPLAIILVAPRRRIAVTAFLCGIAPCWRVWNQLQPSTNWNRTDLRYDALLTGALAALMAADPWWQGIIERSVRRPGVALGGMLTLLLTCIYWPGELPGPLAVLTIPMELWATAGIILIVSRGLCGPVQAFLNARAVTWIGRASYSLYLWQQPFLRVPGSAPVQGFPVNIGATFSAAALSYYLIERPSARLRARWRGAARSSAAPTTPSTALR